MSSKENKKVIIVDYQLGNLFSVRQALVNIGVNAVISSDPVDVQTADAIVLPGVGAFADAMTNLEKMNLVQPIKNHIDSGKPFLGICLGLQLLFTSSEEFGNSEGLGIIPGTVRKFSTQPAMGDIVKVPQIAWNQIYPAAQRWNNTPLNGLQEGEFLYFVHSFYVVPENNSVALTETSYGNVKYVSSILKDNIFACQFHPEKSAENGLQIYRNWANLNQLI